MVSEICTSPHPEESKTITRTTTKASSSLKASRQLAVAELPTSPEVENKGSLEHSGDVRSVIPEKIQDREGEDLVYDRGYCWVVCFACFLLNGCTWGMNSGFSIYFSVYLNEKTFPGASKLDYAAIGGLAFGAALSLTPLLNFLQGYMGVKQTMILGNCIQFVSLMLASYCKKLWQLYLAQGLLQSFGLALISVPAMTILPHFFRKRRVLSGGIATSGSGTFGIAFNLGMQKVVEVRDPFWGLRAQAIISFVLVWVAILLLKTRSKQHKTEFSVVDTKIYAVYGFWFVALFGILSMFGYVIVLYTIVNYVTSLGYSARQGSIAAAMIQLGSCLGRPLVGLACDRFGAATVAGICYTLSGVLCLGMWIPARNYATVIVFALIMGSIMGSMYGTFAPIVVRLVGLKKMNVAFSNLWVLVAVGSLVAPVIGAALVEGSGGVVNPKQYVYCSLFAGISFILCALCLFLSRGYILGRDKVIAGATSYSDQDLEALEFQSDTLLTTSVPLTITLSHAFNLKCGKA